MTDDETIDKKRLVALCQQHDKAAQGLLYTAYRCRMMTIIHRYVTDNALAQDILHDGFLIILTQIQSLRNPDRLEYWMASIMKNLALHCLSQIPPETVPEEAAVEEDENETEKYELSFNEIMALADRLPRGYGTVFRLAVLEGKSHREIGALLGISPKSSASQLARAKAKLRRLIVSYKKTGLVLLAAFLASVYVAYYSKRSGRKLSERDTAVNNVPKPIHYAPAGPANTTAHATASKGITVMSEDTSDKDAASIAVPDKAAFYTAGNLPCDTTAYMADSIVPFTLHQEKDNSQNNVAERYASVPLKKSDSWKIAVSSNLLGLARKDNTSGTGNSMADPSPDGHPSPGVPVVHTSVRHLLPLTFGLRFSKGLTKSWMIEIGVQYSLLRSSVIHTTTDNWSYVQQVRAGFISLPLSLRYGWFKGQTVSAYAAGGVSLGLPVRASVDSRETDEHITFRAPACVSLHTSLGLEYRLSSSVSLFVEPSVNYHIMDRPAYPLLWHDRPLTFDLPVGIRFSW